jgi:hypothetical protein
MFGKFVHLPYYSESELCSGAVKVPPLASDALLTTLHPLLENMLQTVDRFEISCLGAPFHGWKSTEMAWGEIWTVWRMF